MTQGCRGVLRQPCFEGRLSQGLSHGGLGRNPVCRRGLWQFPVKPGEVVARCRRVVASGVS